MAFPRKKAILKAGFKRQEKSGTKIARRQPPKKESPAVALNKGRRASLRRLA